MKIIWTGSYKKFNEINLKKNPFETRKWLDQVFKKKNLTSNYKKNNSHDNVLNQYLLTFDFLNKNYLKKPINIIDFGGGAGDLYFKIKKKYENLILDYKVYENKYLVSFLTKKYNNAGLKFISKLPHNQKIDLFFAGSSMQYIDDWKKLLLKYIKLKTKFFIFCDFPILNKKSIITKQNYYNNDIPVRLYKFDDVVYYFKENDYKLVYKKKFKNNYENKFSKNIIKYKPKFYKLIFVNQKIIK